MTSYPTKVNGNGDVHAVLSRTEFSELWAELKTDQRGLKLVTVHRNINMGDHPIHHLVTLTVEEMQRLTATAEKWQPSH